MNYPYLPLYFIVPDIVRSLRMAYLRVMITNYSDFRLKLKSYLDKVFQSNTPLYVTRTKGENVVVLSESDYESLMETFYLLKSPKNAERLFRAVDQYNEGKGQERDFIEP